MSKQPKFRRLPLGLGQVSKFDKRVLTHLHIQSSILAEHEEKIARNTVIQTRIAAIQIFISVVTTVFLLYVAFLQFGATDRQASIAEAQNRLEYAKVAPRFTVRQGLLQTGIVGAVPSAFPANIEVRISRGDASLNDVIAVQEIRIFLLDGDSHTCVIRLDNYFENSPRNITDFVARSEFSNIAKNSTFYEDGNFRKFIMLSPEKTLVSIFFDDVFDKTRRIRFIGEDGNVDQLPSGEFPVSSIYETIEATFIAGQVKIPGSFKLRGEEPATKGCRSIFGLEGGVAGFNGIRS